MYNLEKKFHNLLENVEIVSFDIFDTLLIRPYKQPTDLFEHLEKLSGKENFSKKRILAERKARTKLKAEEEDIEFDDIYSNILPEYKNLKDDELKLEFQTLKANPIIKKMYEEAINAGKTVIATSDMYLSKDFLKKVLDANGYQEIKHIYVSSTCKKCKGTKNIYKLILEDLKIEPQKILHVGDNLTADYYRSKECDFSALLIPQIIKNCPNIWTKRLEKIKNTKNQLEIGILKALFARNNLRKEGYWHNFGYYLGGPFVVGYLEKIKEWVKLYNIDSLLFISRDGYVLSEAFKILADGDIENKYVYAPRILNLKCFLDYRDKMDYLKIILKLMQNINPKITNIPQDYEEAKEVFNKFKPEFIDYAKNNRIEYEHYLESINIQGSRIATVDMTTGLYSSLSFLKKFLQEKLVLGFFSCAFADAEELPYNIFYNRRLTNDDNEIVCLSEFLITAPEPPLEDLINKKPVYKKIGKHEQKNLEIYPLIMEGILNFVRDYKTLFNDFPIQIPAQTVYDLLKVFIETTEKQDRKHLAQIYFSEDACTEKYRSLYSYMGFNYFLRQKIKIPYRKLRARYVDFKREIKKQIKYFLYEHSKFRIR